MLQGLSPARTRSTRAGCARPLDFYPAPRLPRMREAQLQRRPAEPLIPRPRPLDEGDSVGTEVVVEQRRVLVLEVFQAIEVEMGDRHPPALVALADREGGRGDGPGDAEGGAGAADQRRLAAAELAGEEDQVARLQPLGDAGAERFGLLGRP